MPKECKRGETTGKSSADRTAPAERKTSPKSLGTRRAWAAAWAGAEELGLQDFIQHQFWLAGGLMLAALGTVPWLWTLCLSHPWLVLWGLAALFLLVHVGTLLERHGLAALLPPGAVRICSQPLFELLRLIVAKVTIYASTFLRIGMLVCVELTEEQSREILEGLDPSLRRDVFQRPLVQLLPEPLQRLLLGGRWEEHRPSQHQHQHRQARAPTETYAPTINEATDAGAGEPDEEPSQAPPAPAASPAEPLDGLSARAAGLLGRKSSADGLLELVRGMDDVVQNTRAKGTVSMLEGILSQKVAGSAVNAARAAMSSAKASAAETYEYGKTKVSALGEGVREVATDRKTQATAASAVGGAVTLGASGGASGLISGGLVGAAAGVVPAFFTFGLSIPIGAAIGGGTGLCLGTTVGSTAGFFGGGMAGYSLYTRRGSGGEAGSEGDDHSESSENTTTGSFG